jgi:hypothetical protein
VSIQAKESDFSYDDSNRHISLLCSSTVSRGSSVDIATPYGLEGPGIIILSALDYTDLIRRETYKGSNRMRTLCKLSGCLLSSKGDIDGAVYGFGNSELVGTL